MTVTAPLVATAVPVVPPTLILTVNCSDPSVVKSAAGTNENEAALLLMINDALSGLRSALEVVMLLAVQYKTVPLATPVVLTLNVPVAPSLILAGAVI